MARPMLTSEKRAQVAACAEAIQEAARLLSDLAADETVRSERRLELDVLLRGQEQARRRLLELWS